MRTAVIVVAAAGALLAAPHAPADLVTVSAAMDNTLYEDDSGALSNGAGDHFFAGRALTGAVRRGLISFDPASAVPAGSVIESVMLTLHMSRTIGPETSVGLHRVLRQWGEGTSHAPGEEGGGAPATPGDATWLHASWDGVFWDRPGGDYAMTPSATALIGGIDFYSWASKGLVADVQSWLDEPDANFGWMLLGNEATIVTAKRFDSRENPNESVRPLLTIEYTPVPAPAASLVLLAGLLAGGRRRR